MLAADYKLVTYGKGTYSILINSNTPESKITVSTSSNLNIRRSLRIVALPDGMLNQLTNIELNSRILPKGINQRTHRPIPHALEIMFHPLDHNSPLKRASLGRRPHLVIIPELKHRLGRDVRNLERREDFRNCEFTTLFLGDALHDTRKRNLETAGEIEVEVLLDNPGDAALAGLRVDTDDSLVRRPEILGVDGEIWHIPYPVIPGALHRKALLDSILVRPRKGGKDEVSGVRMTRVNRQITAFSVDAHDGREIGKVDARFDALGVEIEGEGDEVDVPGSFAVAKEDALDTVCTGHLREFTGGDGAPTIVVGVETDAAFLALGDVCAKVFDLIGIYVWRRHFHCRGKIKDDGVIHRRFPRRLDGIANFYGKVGFGGGERFGRVLVDPVGIRIRVLCDVSHILCTPHSKFNRLLLGVVEDNLAEARTGGVVEVNDGFFCTADGLDRSFYQFFAARREDLDGDVVRDCAGGLDETADKVEFGLRGRGKGHFDFLVAAFYEHLKVPPLLLTVHWVDQGLIAVS